MTTLHRRIFSSLAGSAALALSMLALPAHARTDIGVSIALPGLVIQSGSVYHAPRAPSYGAVYSAPSYGYAPPIYSNMPPPVYFEPQPVYMPPQVVYAPNQYYQASPYYAVPAPIYLGPRHDNRYRQAMRDRDRDGIPDRYERNHSRDGSPGYRR